MRDLFLKNLKLQDEQGGIRSYDYYITIGELDVGRYACESYGIRIEEQGGMQASVDNITCSIARIDELSELILRNEVTPVTLADVVSDWL